MGDCQSKSSRIRHLCGLARKPFVCLSPELDVAATFARWLRINHAPTVQGPGALP
jgi:hypothetical protein